MADYCCNAYMRELDVDAHRWLPSEILGDIGVVVDTAERRRLAVVEDIAARLAGVLGAAVERTNHHAVRCPSGTVSTANSFPRLHAAPAEERTLPFLSNKIGRVLDMAVSLPRFAQTRQLPLIANANMPPARRSDGGGTGVFSPRAGANNGMRSSRPTGGDINAAAGVKPPPLRHSKQQCRPSRQQRRRGGEHEATIARTSRRQLHDLPTHAVAATAGRPEQPPRRAAGVNAAPRLSPGSRSRWNGFIDDSSQPRCTRMIKPVISSV